MMDVYVHEHTLVLEGRTIQCSACPYVDGSADAEVFIDDPCLNCGARTEEASQTGYCVGCFEALGLANMPEGGEL